MFSSWREEKCRGCMYENVCDFITRRIEHEKKIRDDAIDEFAEHMKKLCRGIIYAENYIDTIVKTMKTD